MIRLNVFAFLVVQIDDRAADLFGVFRRIKQDLIIWQFDECSPTPAREYISLKQEVKQTRLAHSILNKTNN